MRKAVYDVTNKRLCISTTIRRYVLLKTHHTVRKLFVMNSDFPTERSVGKVPYKYSKKQVEKQQKVTKNTVEKSLKSLYK